MLVFITQLVGLALVAVLSLVTSYYLALAAVAVLARRQDPPSPTSRAIASAWFAALRLLDSHLIALICSMQGPTLVVCPATIMGQWLREFHDWYRLLVIGYPFHQRFLVVAALQQVP